MPSAWRIAPSPPMDWHSSEAIGNLYLSDNEAKPAAPGPRSALVRIKAAALNARDAMVIARSPAFPNVAKPHLIAGGDGAGVVEAVGPDSRWKIGDTVLLTTNLWVDGDVLVMDRSTSLGAGDQDGTLTEYAVLADDRLVPAPTHLSSAEAAALGLAAGTASNALFYGPQPFKKGMTVLTQGTGGVSCFAIQLASASGATVIATSSSDEKLETARKLGATHLINYTKTPDWAAEVLRITQGKGVDHVLDLGGVGTVAQSIRSVRPGGLVSLIGFLAGGEPTNLIPAIVGGAKVVRGVMGSRRDMIEKAVQIINDHQLHPVISKLYQWQDVKAAFEALVSKSGVGKIVIKVGD
ncbi:hypothetical protein A1O1_05980 [Capronia coronata CBS 617.96]|uniref:Enoyl reductase (ER) domain-containing protein n=1 Tax=Capronia coronata CBS 617.96 TaxID=1182541 RepID=W9YTJ7_9EURO|nr:uncharacterized protein A1O1_05980 [Capronia coronata CBS 617.96]EXJ85614.1 hypothetical protein A1O1_05980 [Capronia coronata CBS 617.96]